MNMPDPQDHDQNHPPKEQHDSEAEEDNEEDEQESNVEAAVLSRSKRSTAGKRLTSLVGKAAEDDQAFWSHETWVEEGSDNDSFRESDEDPENRVDTFDSDFDDSENENEQQDEEAAGAGEDEELAKQEKRQQRQQRSKFNVAKAARDLARGMAAASGGGAGSTGAGGKARILGDGDNAGIVLNLPPRASEMDKLYAIPGVAIAPFGSTISLMPVTAASSPATKLASLSDDTATIPAASLSKPDEVAFYVAPDSPTSYIKTKQLETPPSPAQMTALPPGQVPQPATKAAPSTHAQTTASSHIHSPSSVSEVSTALSQLRPARRATQQSIYSNRYRTARNLPMSGQTISNSNADGSAMFEGEVPATGTASHSSSKRKLTVAERVGDKAKRHRTEFTQDELLMEAVHTTAPENHRWLLGRKRAAEEMEYFDKLAAAANKLGGSSDKKLLERYSSKRGALNVVSFFEMDHVPSIFTTQHRNCKPKPKPAVCVITGKPARYRDPKSWLPYYDKNAFVELRKRLEDGRLKPSAPKTLHTLAAAELSMVAPTRQTAPKNGNNGNNPQNSRVANNGNNGKHLTTATKNGTSSKATKPATGSKAKAKASSRKSATATAGKKKAAGDGSAPKPGRGRPRKNPIAPVAADGARSAGQEASAPLSTGAATDGATKPGGGVSVDVAAPSAAQVEPGGVVTEIHSSTLEALAAAAAVGAPAAQKKQQPGACTSSAVTPTKMAEQRTSTPPVTLLQNELFLPSTPITPPNKDPHLTIISDSVNRQQTPASYPHPTASISFNSNQQSSTLSASAQTVFTATGKVVATLPPSFDVQNSVQKSFASTSNTTAQKDTAASPRKRAAAKPDKRQQEEAVPTAAPKTGAGRPASQPAAGSVVVLGPDACAKALPIPKEPLPPPPSTNTSKG